MPPIAAAAIALAPAAAVGVGVYSIVEGRKQAKKAESAAEKQAQREWELQEREAGEYFDLTRKQMELQAQASNIKTLTDIIGKRKEPETRIYTLPTAYKPTPVEQINQAIGQLFGV